MIETTIQKFEIKLRYLEGLEGEISVYVIPANNPNLCQLIKVPVLSLNMHTLVADESISYADLKLNSIYFSGAFKETDMVNWVRGMLPNIPQTIQDQQQLVFVSTFVGSILTYQYKDSLATFRSNSASTIVIIKKFIVKEANQRGIQIDVKWDTEVDSVNCILELMNDRFLQNKVIQQKHSLIPALKELKQNVHQLSGLPLFRAPSFTFSAPALDFAIIRIIRKKKKKTEK